MIGNGLGPAWFPARVRKWLTDAGKLFFDEAAWEIHDESYAAGDPARHICDRGFLAAMLRDASLARPTAKMAACTIFAWFLWALVRLMGWASYAKKS